MPHLEGLLEQKYSFDMYVNLFAFANGVYDFNEINFRDILPSDMITMNCCYEYCAYFINKQHIPNIKNEKFIPHLRF